MTKKEYFSLKDAEMIGRAIGVDWKKNRFGVKEFWTGIRVELEHGSRDPVTNVTNDDPILTGKIALAHLNEFPDYYKRLEKMEKGAEKAHRKR
ncbi:hypothetical protein H0N98_03915 [Candidatus Micrarchaeota archaeon]|nr:hypothetical protein [Candidatus Micrarchaeota archaeon]